MSTHLSFAAILLLAGTCWAHHPNHRLTFRLLVDRSLRPLNHPLEWGDGSPDNVLGFEGIVQHPSKAHLILGEAIGGARIEAQPSLEAEDAILGLNVRHMIQLTRGNIVDDDFASVAPLLDSPTRTDTHGQSTTTDLTNIRHSAHASTKERMALSASMAICI